jgi:predicted metalloprotease with PDZ domain
MKRKISCFLIFIFYLAIELAHAAQAMYSVTIPENNWRIAKVSCQIMLKNGLLYMNNEGAEDVPNGYAHFIQNLNISDTTGSPLPVEDLGGARWKTKFQTTQPIILSYEVLLNHDESAFSWNDEIPYGREDCVFWTGRALFILSDTHDISVHFDIPTGWRVTTPWQSIKSQNNSFSVKDEVDLAESFILAGTHIESQVSMKDTELLIAIGGWLKESMQILQETVKKFPEPFTKLFHGAPKGRMLIILNPFNEKDSLTGSIFGRCVSALGGYPLTIENKTKWVHFFAHEFFHIWNGGTIRYAKQEYWFSEGFTEYYSYVMLARLGLISEQDFLNSLAVAFKEYLAKSGQISIRCAENENLFTFPLIYDGGRLFAASLDIKIRKYTNNRKSLDDLMQQMFQEFGETGSKYSMKDVIRIANSISGNDLTNFFEKYIEGANELPFEEYLGYAGLEAQKHIGKSQLSSEYVIKKLLQIQSLGHAPEGLIIHTPKDKAYQDKDVLVAIEGRPVKTHDDIRNIAENWKSGNQVTLTLKRGNREITIVIILGGEKGKVIMERTVEVTITKKKKITNKEQSILLGILNN